MSFYGSKSFHTSDKGLCVGIGIALFHDQINILAEDVTFGNLHLWENGAVA